MVYNKYPVNLLTKKAVSKHFKDTSGYKIIIHVAVYFWLILKSKLNINMPIIIFMIVVFWICQVCFF